MKKLAVVLLLALGLAVLGACGRGDFEPLAFPEDGSLVRVNIGASATPHRIILDYIRPALREAGIDLYIREFMDFNIPNQALVDGDIHANYFQHMPFLHIFLERTGHELHVVGEVHVEPIGAYSLTLDDIMDIPYGGSVAMPQDPANSGRALMLLEKAGLIRLNPNIDPAAGVLATAEDIIYNPRNLRMLLLDAPSVARLGLLGRDADVSIVNTNVLLEATDLCPINDSLIREAVFGNPYANLLVVRPEDADSEVIRVLYEHLTSEAVRAFILRTFTGVAPVF